MVARAYDSIVASSVDGAQKFSWAVRFSNLSYSVGVFRARRETSRDAGEVAEWLKAAVC
jgi:hypothetical protein